MANLLDKRHIMEIMRPCVLLVLLVPKNDGSWGICEDCREIKNITIKYKNIFFRLVDMSDDFHGSCIFSKIDLKSNYHQIKMEEG